MLQMCFCCTVGNGEFFRSRLGICFEVEKFASRPDEATVLWWLKGVKDLSMNQGIHGIKRSAKHDVQMWLEKSKPTTDLTKRQCVYFTVY